MVAHGRGGRGRPIRNTFPRRCRPRPFPVLQQAGNVPLQAALVLRGQAAVPAVFPPCNPLGHPTVTSAPFIPQRTAGRDGPFKFCGTDRSCHYRGHKWPRASHRRVRRSVNRLRANPRSSPNGVGAEGRCGTSPSSGLCARGDAHLSTLRNCR
jgi:hypothetical protein